MIIAYFLSLPLSVMLLFATLGEYSNHFYDVLVGVIGLLPASLVLCSVAAVVFQRLKWAAATWVSVAIPLSLMSFIGVMIILAATTTLDGT